MVGATGFEPARRTRPRRLGLAGSLGGVFSGGFAPYGAASGFALASPTLGGRWFKSLVAARKQREPPVAERLSRSWSGRLDLNQLAAPALADSGRTARLAACLQGASPPTAPRRASPSRRLPREVAGSN